MKREITMGEKYGPAMEITDQLNADFYFEKCVQHTMSFGKNRTETENIERQNLGYYAGYYNNETRERIERLFNCSHPIFGSIAKNGPPTPEEAFRREVYGDMSPQQRKYSRKDNGAIIADPLRRAYQDRKKEEPC